MEIVYVPECPGTAVGFGGGSQVSGKVGIYSRIPSCRNGTTIESEANLENVSLLGMIGQSTGFKGGPGGICGGHGNGKDTLGGVNGLGAGVIGACPSAGGRIVIFAGNGVSAGTAICVV